MINCEKFYQYLLEKNINFFTGVPDSLLKDFCSYIMDNAGQNHVISANEGNAVALAAGHYLASGNIGLVYMQNSGIGNAINPLASLVDPEVYSIPVLMIVGWRGEPNVKDEPQHIKQGKVTTGLFDALSIPYDILPASLDEAKVCLDKACNYMRENSSPYVIIIKKDTFEKYSLQNKIKNNYPVSREEAIKRIVDTLSPEDIIVSTTGKASRELFEYRDYLHQGHDKDFLTVGSMGHSSQVALGIALEKKNRKVYCLDGDGAAIMHMGAWAIIGSKAPENFRHIILNNGCHESVGGQPTAGFSINMQMLAQACGYKNIYLAETLEEIESKINLLKNSVGPSLLEIRINSSSRENLGRPNISPVDNKKDFIKFIRNS
ncbi:MAG: phosphonopyruvate decarboxylase [Candidatus Falkowbacteria bacterium]|nr:phosphonopyruvate decarboxylase [Candidatus Falkowbacteria bacterium]